MTDHELQLLFIGVALGMDLMLLVHIWFGVLDDRHDRKVARAAQAQLDAARERAAQVTGSTVMADLPSFSHSPSTSTPADLRESSGVRR